MCSVVRARGIRGYRALMQELGHDPNPLLSHFRIDPELLDSHEAVIPLKAVCALLETSSQVTKCPDFGLRMSLKQDINILGPLGIVMQNAKSPFEAIEIAGRYISTHSPALSLHVSDPSPAYDDAISVSIVMNLPEAPRQRQTIDLSLGTSFQISRIIKPHGHKVKAVTLPHSALAPLGVYRRYFGTAVLENEPLAALHLEKTGWRDVTASHNQAVQQIAMDYLSRQLELSDRSMADRVRSLLLPLLATVQANRNDIARMLNLHPRTLQRRLADEGTSFQAIKDSIRQELAKKYMLETDMSLTQLSDLLGFPEQSALSRAFRTWFGISPTTFRARSASSATGDVTHPL